MQQIPPKSIYTFQKTGISINGSYNSDNYAINNHGTLVSIDLNTILPTNILLYYFTVTSASLNVKLKYSVREDINADGSIYIQNGSEKQNAGIFNMFTIPQGTIDTISVECNIRSMNECEYPIFINAPFNNIYSYPINIYSKISYNKPEMIMSLYTYTKTDTISYTYNITLSVYALCYTL